MLQQNQNNLNNNANQGANIGGNAGVGRPSVINAGIQGKTDSLEGMKENIIAGLLINAGTGIPKRVLDSQVAYMMNK